MTSLLEFDSANALSANIDGFSTHLVTTAGCLWLGHCCLTNRDKTIVGE
jgi:hypothetical protein